MLQIPINQAATMLDKLLDEAAKGQEVVIIGANGSAFKLVVLPSIPKPIFGSAKGLVRLDLDAEEASALAAETYLEERATRGDRVKFEAALMKGADVEPPDERDRLQHGL